MKPLIKQLGVLYTAVADAMERLNISADEQKLASLETSMAEPDFWTDQTQAEATSKQASGLRSYITKWQNLLSDIKTTMELAELEGEDQSQEYSKLYTALEGRVREAMIDVQLSGEFDNAVALVQISAGVGGTDAQDWAMMLQEMYIKYANTKGFRVAVLDTSYGEEAGIKSTTLRIEGQFAYGLLKCEKGVHRLVRLSPFNSNNLRQTSFALVDVVPELADEQIKLDDKDVKVDVFRAGGNGGQSVNTTDSAVRMTHIPTGINVVIQNERSQLQNKETARAVLYARLSELARLQKLEDIAELRGNVASADWGSQIRSYVLHPYTKVKDHRTGYETSDASGVLQGKIGPFIEAYLTQEMSQDIRENDAS